MRLIDDLTDESGLGFVADAALLWLVIVTGIALVVALDLNLSNLFNP